MHVVDRVSPGVELVSHALEAVFVRLELVFGVVDLVFVVDELVSHADERVSHVVELVSRVVGGVKRVWDVYKLWELAAGLPVKTVEIASFKELDLDCWFGGKAPTMRQVGEHCRKIMNADLKYPVILNADGSLMDGGHRIVKSMILGQTSIKAVQFEQIPPPISEKAVENV